MAPRLKVFVTSDGLTDYVVAASSKPKALAAWGAHQDLFKTGLAHETDDPALAEAARAQPGEVLRRPAGSRATLARMKTARPSRLKGPSQAALRKVADLEARLAAADREHGVALQKIEAERAVLDRRIEALRVQHAKARDRLQAALSAAKRAPG